MDNIKIMSAIIRAIPSVIPHLSPETWQAFKAAPGYTGVRNTYWAIIYDAVYDYLTGNQPVTSFKNAMKRGMADAFIGAAEIGYEAGGGELPFDEETLAWLGAAQTTELGYIDGLFDRLKVEWDGIDPIKEAFARADGFAGTLDQIYNEATMRGAKNKMFTFVGSDGKESCKDCQRMKGQRHRGSWWVKHDLIPGSHNYECGGWNCEHILVDDQGNEMTL